MERLEPGIIKVNFDVAFMRADEFQIGVVAQDSDMVAREETERKSHPGGR